MRPPTPTKLRLGLGVLKRKYSANTPTSAWLYSDWAITNEGTARQKPKTANRVMRFMLILSPQLSPPATHLACAAEVTPTGAGESQFWMRSPKAGVGLSHGL